MAAILSRPLFVNRKMRGIRVITMHEYIEVNRQDIDFKYQYEWKTL